MMGHILGQTLKHGLRSMLRMKRVIDGEWKLESDAAKIGTAIHCFVGLVRSDSFLPESSVV